MICLNRLPFLILILFLSFKPSETILDNNITHPKLYTNQQILSSRVEGQNRKFSISFPNINYQLNGIVYETQNTLTADQIYDIKNYNISESCVFYKTNFNLDLLFGVDLDYIVEHSAIAQDEHRIYVIGYIEPTDYSLPVQRFLKIYSFDNSRINQIETKSLGQTLLKVGFQQDSFLLYYSSSIFISDGDNLYQTKISKNQNHSVTLVQGLNSNQNTQDFQFLGMTIQENQLVFLYQNKVAIYSINSNSDSYKIQLDVQIKKEDKLIYDVQFSKDQIFVLAQNILRIYKKQTQSIPIDIQLQGESCSRIYLKGDVIQIICKFKELIYVAEYQYDSLKQTITLNRYYNELSDYRLIQFSGNQKDKILMVGDDQIILTNFAINREILMELGDGTSNSQTIYSFGVQKIQSLKQYSDSLTTTSLGIAEDFILLLKLSQIPPQIQCNLKNSQSSYINLLVVTNTSKCQFNTEESSLASICTNFKPIQIFISTIQIQKKMSVLFILLIIIMILVIILLCLGWVFNVNLNHKRIISSIKNKIKKIKSGSKQIKKI